MNEHNAFCAERLPDHLADRIADMRLNLTGDDFDAAAEFCSRFIEAIDWSQK